MDIWWGQTCLPLPKSTWVYWDRFWESSLLFDIKLNLVQVPSPLHALMLGCSAWSGRDDANHFSTFWWFGAGQQEGLCVGFVAEQAPGLQSNFNFTLTFNNMYCTSVMCMILLLSLRFNEWGRAALALQIKFMKAPQGPNWRFLSVGLDGGETTADSLRTHIENRVMEELSKNAISNQFAFNSSEYGIRAFKDLLQSQDYWDTCREAGPQSRDATPFEQPPPTLKVLAKDVSSMKFLVVTAVSRCFFAVLTQGLVFVMVSRGLLVPEAVFASFGEGLPWWKVWCHRKET